MLALKKSYSAYKIKNIKHINCWIKILKSKAYKIKQLIEDSNWIINKIKHLIKAIK